MVCIQSQKPEIFKNRNGNIFSDFKAFIVGAQYRSISMLLRSCLSGTFSKS